ncbi:MAG: hypothetical protein M3O30_04350 [Planctomycetota bacterium]|nr:hypothetical protein [Planctomycetota bacterium]
MTQPPTDQPAPLPAPPFWQRRWVHDALPLATSIVFHLTIFVTAVLLVPPLVHSVIHDTSKEEVIVPDTTLAPNNHIGGVPNAGLSNDPLRSAAQEHDPTADNHGWADRQSESLSQALGGGTGMNDDLSSGTQKASGRTHDNAALNPFTEGENRTANFGPRGGGAGMGPRSKIFGEGSNVRSVVYVCDGSGSLIGGKDQTLRVELKNAVAHLSPIQAFDILIFQDNKDTGGQYQSPSGNGLTMASPANQSKVFDFLDRRMIFHGTTNPVPALEQAFHEKPQLIYLLTDGEFDDPSGDKVLAKINELNRDKKVHVNTVLLLGSKREQDQYKDFEGIMDKIASQNGGVYKKYYSDNL